MSTFTVRIELKTKKLDRLTIEEHYSDWAEADAAYCGYRDACRVQGSSISHAELIEHREERMCAAVSKGTPKKVVHLEKANGTHG